MKTEQIHLVVDVPEDCEDVNPQITIDDMLRDVNPEYWQWHIIEAGEPLAWLIDWPDEPELGSYFSEATSENGRSRPLYLHPSGDAKDTELLISKIAELEAWQAAAFDAHPNLDLDIEASKEK